MGSGGRERVAVTEVDTGVREWLKLPDGIRAEYAKAGLRIQLTPQCDGGCPFCRVSHKGKPTHSIAPDAVRMLIRDATSLCGGPQEYMAPNDLYYHGSDVGTYARLMGGKILNSFVDLSVSGGRNAVFSTAVPAGSEQELANFVNALYGDQLSAVEYGYAGVRISRSGHNSKRVDTLLDLLSPAARRSVPVTERTDESIFKAGELIDPEADSPLHMRGIYRRADAVVIGSHGLYAHFFMPQCRIIPGGELLVPISPERVILPNPRNHHTRQIDGYPIALYTPEDQLWKGLFEGDAERARTFVLSARYLLNILDCITDYLPSTQGYDPLASKAEFWRAFKQIDHSIQQKILSQRVIQNCHNIAGITECDAVLDGFRRQCIDVGLRVHGSNL